MTYQGYIMLYNVVRYIAEINVQHHIKIKQQHGEKETPEIVLIQSVNVVKTVWGLVFLIQYTEYNNVIITL